jgi:hypothetical protein
MRRQVDHIFMLSVVVEGKASLAFAQRGCSYAGEGGGIHVPLPRPCALRPVPSTLCPLPSDISNYSKRRGSRVVGDRARRVTAVLSGEACSSRQQTAGSRHAKTAADSRHAKTADSRHARTAADSRHACMHA